MTDSYFAAFNAGDANAIGAMMDFYGGTGTFASWPKRVRDYAIETNEFIDFNTRWMEACLPHLCDGGLFGTFIDWRGYPRVHSAATGCGLIQLNLITWVKTNAGMGNLYRSQHELLPRYKNGWI